MKMRNIINDGMKRDLQGEQSSSREIGDLYEVFRSLIKTKKFENNDFKDKEDALAVIDLAEASKMFIEEAQKNHKAAGICYNNIGSIQFKQGKFDQAAENFKLAIDQAKLSLDRLQSEKEVKEKTGSKKGSRERSKRRKMSKKEVTENML
jgi:tetratricopeptide (TPR) repeat protein